jgi:predicted metalloendopeptidase
MLALQDKVDKKLWQLPRDPQSPFLQTLHARWRTWRQSDLITEVIQKIQDIKESQDIPGVLRCLHEYGAHALFQLQYDPDLEHPKQEILYLRLQEPHFTDTSEDHSPYTRALFQAFQVGYPKGKNSSVEHPSDKKRVNEIEINLQPYRPPRHDLQSAQLCFNPQDSKHLSPRLKWILNYFSPWQVSRFSVDSVIYFEMLGEMLNNPRLLAKWKNYLMFQWLHHVSSFFSDTEALFFEYEREDIKDVIKGSREDDIMHYASRAWWQDAGKQFVQSDFEHLDQCRKSVKVMAEYLRRALKQMFQQSHWQKSTQMAAHAKLHRMEFLIGWSPLEEEETFPMISSQDFYDEAILRGYKYQFEMVGRHNHARTQRQAWRCSGYNEVNAFYSRELNVLYLPACLFYEPFFSLRPNRVPENFAAIGSIIAHEIYHGFDYDSRMVTAEGRLHNWWAPIDDKNFLKNVQKTIRLYAAKRSVIGPHRINGRLTLSENIADIIALQMAWQAFLLYKRKQKQICTNEEAQQFFRMFAVSQTQVYSQHALEMSLETDYHALAMARVNIPLSIFPPFLELYRVQSKDPMFTPQSQRPEFIAQV